MKVTISDTLTRGGNTTQYTAGDRVGNTTSNKHFDFLFPSAPPVLGGVITSARIIFHANVATKMDSELWLFSTIQSGSDNAAWAPSEGNMAGCLGVIDFDTASVKVGLATVGVGGNAFIQANGLNLNFTAQTNSIYGTLVVRNGYIPVASEIFTIRLVVTL